MTIRCHFHLLGRDKFIWDPVGVEVAQLAQAESVAIDIIREFRREELSRERELRDWKLAVTDSEGTIVVVLPLLASD
jgi:hypothetical protein